MCPTIGGSPGLDQICKDEIMTAVYHIRYCSPPQHSRASSFDHISVNAAPFAFRAVVTSLYMLCAVSERHIMAHNEFESAVYSVLMITLGE